MSEEFGPTFITVTDDDGNEIELEYVDAVELDGVTYMAFFPAVTEEDQEEDDETGLVILKRILENGEELLSTPDSDEELERAYDALMEILFDEEEED